MWLGCGSKYGRWGDRKAIRFGEMFMVNLGLWFWGICSTIMKKMIVVGTSYGRLGGCVRLMEGVWVMVMRHGCARGTREKLTEFLTTQTPGRAVTKRPHCTEAWERRPFAYTRERAQWILCQVGPECWTLMRNTNSNNAWTLNLNNNS